MRGCGLEFERQSDGARHSGVRMAFLGQILLFVVTYVILVTFCNKSIDASHRVTHFLFPGSDGRQGGRRQTQQQAIDGGRVRVVNGIIGCVLLTLAILHIYANPRLRHYLGGALAFASL